MPEIQLALKKGNIEVNELMNLLDHDNSDTIAKVLGQCECFSRLTQSDRPST
eukprot:gene22659-21326_t